MRPNGLRRMRMRGCQAPGCWRPGIGKPGSTRPFHPGLILELEAKPWAKKRSPPNDDKEDSWGDGLYWPQLSPRPTLNPFTRHTGHATPIQALLVTPNNHVDVMAAYCIISTTSPSNCLFPPLSPWMIGMIGLKLRLSSHLTCVFSSQRWDWALSFFLPSSQPPTTPQPVIALLRAEKGWNFSVQCLLYLIQNNTRRETKAQQLIFYIFVESFIFSGKFVSIPVITRPGSSGSSVRPAPSCLLWAEFSILSFHDNTGVSRKLENVFFGELFSKNENCI